MGIGSFIKEMDRTVRKWIAYHLKGIGSYREMCLTSREMDCN